MRITDGIHLVASGALAGFGLTDAFDCSAWAIDTGDGWLLFDAGAGRDLDAVLGVMREDGIDPAALRHLFLTHAHADHSGGAKGLVARLGGAVEVVCGPGTAEILAQDDDRLVHLDRARKSGVYPADYVWRAPAVDRVLADGETMAAGGAEITAVATPGHCDDHVSYLVAARGRRILITGDALFVGPAVALQDIPDCSVPATIASIRRLSDLTFDAFLPGHGLFAVKDGMSHVAQAMTYVDRFLPPPNLLR